MNIDELVDVVTEEKLRTDLKQLIGRWKADATDVHHLGGLIEAWHGNVGSRSQGIQDEFYKKFQSFQSKAIDGLGGMTMNERLYWFGLFEEWDRSDAIGQERIRGKLHAPA